MVIQLVLDGLWVVLLQQLDSKLNNRTDEALVRLTSNFQVRCIFTRRTFV